MSYRDLKGLENWYFPIILDIYRPSRPHLNMHLGRNSKAASIFGIYHLGTWWSSLSGVFGHSWTDSGVTPYHLKCRTVQIKSPSQVAEYIVYI